MLPVFFKKARPLQCLAVCCDTGHPLPLEREGLWIHCRLVLEALLKVHPSLTIEIWSYSFSTPYIKTWLNPLLQQYSKNFRFYNENRIQHPDTKTVKPLKKWRLRLKQWLKHRQFVLTRSRKSAKSVVHVRRFFKAQYRMTPQQRQACLSIAFQRYSKAQVAYVPYVGLTLGHFFKGPVVVQVHDLFTLALRDLFYVQNPDIDEKNRAFQAILGQYALNRATFVSSSSYVVQHHTLAHIPHIKTEQTRIIPFPPLIQSNAPLPLEPVASFKQRLGLPAIYMAYPTQIRPNKNSIVLLKALKQLKQEGVALTLVTTGTFKHMPSWQAYLEDNHLQDRVLEVGSLPEKDLYALYKHANLVVVPTLMEGFGMSGQGLEALKVGGIPVIHAKSLGMAESLQSVGLRFETADLNWFELDDAEGLANRIKAVLTNPAPHVEKQQHIVAAYQQHTWENVARQYVTLFEGMIQREVSLS